MTSSQIRFFLEGLTGAFGKGMKSEMRSVWESRLEAVSVTDYQARKVLDSLQTFADWPSLGTVLRMLMDEAARANTLERIWRFWYDSSGRRWAQQSGLSQYSISAADQMEIWKREAASIPEAREAFLAGYQEAGGDPVRFAQLFQALLSGAHIAQIALPEMPEAPGEAEDW